MNFYLFYSPVKNLKDKTIKHMLVPIYETPHNTSGRSDLFDEDIRMHEQPLMFTEECIAVGCPEDLW